VTTKWRPTPDTTTGHYPRPSRNVRLAGIAGLVGAVMWPLTILVIAGATQGCTATACDVDRGSLFVIGLAPVLFAITLIGLELRARRFLGLGDLIGDLTIGTAAALFVLAFVSGAIGFLGPGLLLLLIGSIVFGAVGYLNGSRARVGSAVIAIGAGALVFLLLAGAASGFGAGLETPWLFALLLYGIGWGWLGGSLLLARPLPIPVKPDSDSRRPARRR
jgi:hypothetical protein